MSFSTFSMALLLAAAQATPATPPPAAPAPATTPPVEDVAAPPAAEPPVGGTTRVSGSEPVSKPAAGDDSIVVTGRLRSPDDPLEEVNVKSFEITQSVDKAFVGPLASAYEKTVPNPIRSGFRNFLNNLREPVVFLNYLLQIKPGKAAETFGRFSINTTIGVAGLFDMAKRKPFKLPRRRNGFANTMGYYGVKPGPYFFLPLVGPTTLRDSIGNLLDRLVLPLAIGKPFTQPVYAIPAFVISSLDDRVEYDAELHRLHVDSPDPYKATRESYLKARQAEIDALHTKHGGRGDPPPYYPMAPLPPKDANMFIVPAPQPAPVVRPEMPAPGEAPKPEPAADMSQPALEPLG